MLNSLFERKGVEDLLKFRERNRKFFRGEGTFRKKGEEVSSLVIN